MAIGRHLVIETMEAAARMGKSVLTERIIYPVSFSTLNPQPTVMSTSFAKKISKKVSIFPGELSALPNAVRNTASHPASEPNSRNCLVTPGDIAAIASEKVRSRARPCPMPATQIDTKWLKTRGQTSLVRR